MELIKNIFGEGYLYNEFDLTGKIYVKCCACMSVLSDFLSWANLNPERFTLNPEEADSIVVLGCQVTDLAVLNDIRNVKKLHDITKKDIFLGGCVSQRFDIELPEYIKRLSVVRSIGTPITLRNLVEFDKPFWVKKFEESDNELSEGNLFRNFYPLKIGAGCTGMCKYCTIRHTRGISYETEANSQIEEFLSNENVVLISDSPTEKQIRDWCSIAIDNKKQISIRNLEPNVAYDTFEILLQTAKAGFLKILHIPIQSCRTEVLKAMGRNSNKTLLLINELQELRELGVIVATNIIIDYEIDGEIFPNFDAEFLLRNFDYYVWNPYWNGVWNYELAEKRYNKYLNV